MTLKQSKNAGLDIDISFDLICPWCLIGKRQLDEALKWVRQRHPATAIRTRWHGVQLLPQLPEQGVPFAAFYEHRLGSADAVRARKAQVYAAADRAGLDIDLDRIDVMPNTRKAHRLLELAATINAPLHEALLERLFAAYFSFGENLGDTQTLLTIADGFLLERAEVERAWRHTPAANGHRAPTLSVPLMVFNENHSLMGASSVAELEALMLRLLARPVTDDRSGNSALSFTLPLPASPT